MTRALSYTENIPPAHKVNWVLMPGNDDRARVAVCELNDLARSFFHGKYFVAAMKHCQYLNWK